MATPDGQLSFWHRGGFPFLAMLLFAVLFAATTRLFPAITTEINNDQVIGLFQKFIMAGGVAFGFLSLILTYILYGLRGIFGLKNSKIAMPIILILGYAPWAAFGFQLVYREPRYAMIAKAIIEFTGKPLLYSGGALVILGLGWLVISLISGRK